jgi:hypothetical protein
MKALVSFTQNKFTTFCSEIQGTINFTISKVIFISVLEACSSHALYRDSSGSKAHGLVHQQGHRQRYPIFGQRVRTGRDGPHHPDEAVNEIR